MATIQIRDIPEDAYQVIHRRARLAGRSIQSYMRDLIIDFAAGPTAQEALALLAQAGESSTAPGGTRESILDAMAADRR